MPKSVLQRDGGHLMIFKIVDCIKRLLLRNSDKPEPPKCPDYVPHPDEMTWVDPDNY